MDRLTLESSMTTDLTSVSNIFIDEYMPKANGDFVKVYLHLLRLINSQSRNINLESVADVFNFTERDIFRALKYWEELGLLSLRINKDNVIDGIRLEPFGKDMHYFKGVHSMQINTGGSEQKTAVPLKKKYTRQEIDEFASDNQVGQLMFIAQAYLAKPLSSTDINCLLYMYDALSLPTDLIEYIMETCISAGSKSMTAIEKLAIEFFTHGISDVDAAKDYRRNNSTLARKVLSAFGITGRLPGKEESSFLLRWQDEFGYGEDIIIEACNRTMSHTHAPSFKYANTILDSWHKSGVKNLSDVDKVDCEHARKVSQKAAAKKAAGVASPKLKGGQKIDNRSYDFNSLEKQLMN